MPTLQDNVAKLDQLCHLLSETEIFGSKNHSKQLLKKLQTTTDQRVQQLEHEINEIQLRWDAGNKKEDTLRHEYRSITQTMSIQQQEQKDDEDNFRKETKRSEQLKKELEVLDKELYVETNNANQITGEKLELLELALYRGIGVQMHVEDDMTVKQATLTSANEKDVTIVPITKPSEHSINRLWDIMCKDL